MPIVFPGDKYGEPSRQYNGANSIGGVEKFGAVNGSVISVTNLSASNITTGTLSADRISAGSLNANVLGAGTINASVITVSNIDAGNITTGTLSADRIGANSISATKLSVATLSAITANLGTVTAGTIEGNTIKVGGAYSGGIQVYGNNAASFYDGSNNLGGIIAGSSESIAIGGNHNVLLSPGGGYKVVLGENINMNEKSIDACDTIWAYHFNTRCEIYGGTPNEAYQLLRSFKPDKKSKKADGWSKLDHSQLDKKLYFSKKYKKPIINTKHELVGFESETALEGFSLNKLVDIQRQLILDLESRLLTLESKLAQPN